MIIAIPVNGSTLPRVFGQCESYLFVTVDQEARQILESHTAVAPPHAPGHLSDWIVKPGATTVIVSQIPDSFRRMLEFNELKVIDNVDPAPALDLAQSFLDGTLSSS